MRRPSFPTVIALIALFVALGGTSYAVIKLPAKSVGNRELKSNAVTSAKIRPRSVARSDLSPSARSGVPVAYDVMAILPPGYRPSTRYVFGAGGGGPTDLYGWVDVLPNGEITFMAGATVDSDYTSLDNVSFWTD